MYQSALGPRCQMRRAVPLYPAGGQTTLKVRYRPTIVGQERIQIHVVDTDTKELVRERQGGARGLPAGSSTR